MVEVRFKVEDYSEAAHYILSVAVFSLLTTDEMIDNLLPEERITPLIDIRPFILS
jgi:hypothetical protein